MRRLFIVLWMIAGIFGCVSEKGSNETSNLPKLPEQQAVDNYEYSLTAGTLDIAKRSGCLACHAVDQEVVGPAWKAVSLRYKDYSPAEEYLVNKVKKGGKGAWRNVPMPPYSPRITDETIRSLIKRILEGENGRVALSDNQSISNLVLAGETDKYQFHGLADTVYQLDLVSTTGDADLYIYDPLLQGDAALVDSSELRNTDDSVTLSVTGQDGYFDIDVVAHLDSNYELSVTEIFLISDPAIPSGEELAAYNYTLNGATLLLAKDSNCLACHSTETNIVGPSFKAISLRFKDIPDAETRLIEIVKNGGKGIWGIIPMPPSSPEVSDQNIGLLVHSILFGD